MKNIKILLGLCVIMAINFTSCKKKQDVIIPVYEAPKITNLKFKINGLNYTTTSFEAPASKGDTIHISFSATDDQDLKSWKLTKFVQSESEISVKEENLSGKSSDVKYDFVIPDTAAVDADMILTIYLNDNDATLDPETGDHSIAVANTIKVIANPKPFAINKGGTIYNKLGAQEAAWDLINDVPRPKTDPVSNYHMINNTVDTAFIAGWKSPVKASHVTKFVKAQPTFIYSGSTSEKSAHDAYLAGTALTEVKNVAVNDVYIAAINTTSGSITNTKYVVLKIVAVNKTPGGDTNDNIVFLYKK